MRTVTLNALVLADAPICYGILMPGPHVPDGIPVVKVRDLEHHVIATSDLLRTDPSIDQQYERSRLRAGDILLSIRGTTGRVVLVPAELDGANITQDTARIRVAPELRSYVYHALRSPMVQRQIALHTVGQAVQGINVAAVRKLELPWLSTTQRSAAALALDAYDSLSHELRQLSRAKGAYREMLIQQLISGQRRFPQFAGEPAWRREPLGNFLREKSVRNRGEQVTLVYSCSKVHGIIPQTKRFSRRLASKNVANYKLVSPGDLVYDPMLLWDASIGFVCGAEPGIVSPAYATFALIADERERAFLSRALLSYEVRHRYRVISRGTNVRRKKALPRDFLAIPIPVPPTTEEREYLGRFFDLLDRELALIERHRTVHDRARRALMHRLFSGDIPDLDPAA